jgi:hypothetical protein
MLVAKFVGKWPLGRPRKKWKFKIRMGLSGPRRDEGPEDVRWTELAKDRVQRRY